MDAKQVIALLTDVIDRARSSLEYGLESDPLDALARAVSVIAEEIEEETLTPSEE